MSEVELVLARWREALAWRPSPALLVAAHRQGNGVYRGGWPGFREPPFALQPLPHADHARHLLAAYAAFEALNQAHFGAVCPPVKVVVNPRLRSTGGRVLPAVRTMELNAWRLAELPETLPDIVFHEMIHLWLYAQGLPAGHTAAFRQKMAERGHLSIRYGVEGDPKGLRHAYPGSDRRVVYRCTGCGHEYPRRQRYPRPMLCGRCLRVGQGRHPIVLDRIIHGADPR